MAITVTRILLVLISSLQHQKKKYYKVKHEVKHNGIEII